jgi:hypothetical protein
MIIGGSGVQIFRLLITDQPWSAHSKASIEPLNPSSWSLIQD